MAHSATVERSTPSKTVSETVVFAVAELTGSDPASLDPLYNTVDPDALNALFEESQFGLDRSPSRVSFTYCGCDVVVSADGSVHASKSGEEISIGWS